MASPMPWPLAVTWSPSCRPVATPSPWVWLLPRPSCPQSSGSSSHSISGPSLLCFPSLPPPGSKVQKEVGKPSCHACPWPLSSSTQPLSSASSLVTCSVISAPHASFPFPVVVGSHLSLPALREGHHSLPVRWVSWSAPSGTWSPYGAPDICCIGGISSACNDPGQQVYRTSQRCTQHRSPILFGLRCRYHPHPSPTCRPPQASCLPFPYASSPWVRNLGLLHLHACCVPAIKSLALPIPWAKNLLPSPRRSSRRSKEWSRNTRMPVRLSGSVELSPSALTASGCPPCRSATMPPPRTVSLGLARTHCTHPSARPVLLREGVAQCGNISRFGTRNENLPAPEVLVWTTLPWQRSGGSRWMSASSISECHAVRRPRSRQRALNHFEVLDVGLQVGQLTHRILGKGNLRTWPCRRCSTERSPPQSFLGYPHRVWGPAPPGPPGVAPPPAGGNGAPGTTGTIAATSPGLSVGLPTRRKQTRRNDSTRAASTGDNSLAASPSPNLILPTMVSHVGLGINGTSRTLWRPPMIRRRAPRRSASSPAHRAAASTPSMAWSSASVGSISQGRAFVKQRSSTAGRPSSGYPRLGWPGPLGVPQGVAVVVAKGESNPPSLWGEVDSFLGDPFPGCQDLVHLTLFGIRCPAQSPAAKVITRVPTNSQGNPVGSSTASRGSPWTTNAMQSPLWSESQTSALSQNGIRHPAKGTTTKH